MIQQLFNRALSLVNADLAVGAIQIGAFKSDGDLRLNSEFNQNALHADILQLKFNWFSRDVGSLTDS